MGIHEKITLGTFPEQGTWLGRRVTVCFHYNTKATINGTIVREDTEEPGVTIIRLDNGRHVLATECQFSVIPESTVKMSPDGRSGRINSHESNMREVPKLPGVRLHQGNTQPRGLFRGEDA